MGKQDFILNKLILNCTTNNNLNSKQFIKESFKELILVNTKYKKINKHGLNFENKEHVYVGSFF